VAQRHLAAAERAIAASVLAFRRAADAHGHAAIQHERDAAAGFGDRDEHERQAAIHRAAAVADTQRAECAQLLLDDGEADDARRPSISSACQPQDRYSTEPGSITICQRLLTGWMFALTNR
jgi:hypothetical protein